ncbi:MAG: protein-L-isoaspartate O-methyltransferase [Candidatus Curtissbacteria bacterium]|nr:protein-L-isoaspartate O-methyltransferase [bacterium]MDZ4209720.1 protein-L-isoaspartate O-methyltransferase [Candidatus Curtissbacteria bacterium]
MTLDQLLAELKDEGFLKNPDHAAAMTAIDRADFVPPALVSQAYLNIPLPIGHGQTISQPATVAFMIKLLDPQPGDKILDIGSGSGWQTAILAYLVNRPNNNAKQPKIIALELIPELCQQSKINLNKYDFLKNGAVTVRCQNATKGFPPYAPYDKIIAAASIVAHKTPLESIPPAWLDQLKPGGVIVTPINHSIYKFTKKSGGAFTEKEYSGFVFVPFQNS